MDSATLVAAPDFTGSRSFGLKVASAVVALALVFTMTVLMQNRADAAPASQPVAAASVAGGSAQINFGQIFCAVLLQVRNAFENSPFFGFIQPVIDNLLAAFDCGVSGG